VRLQIPIECDVVIERTNQGVSDVLCKRVSELGATMILLNTKRRSNVRLFPTLPRDCKPQFNVRSVP